jgi:hypothetical protein
MVLAREQSCSDGWQSCGVIAASVLHVAVDVNLPRRLNVLWMSARVATFGDKAVSQQLKYMLVVLQRHKKPAHSS